MTTPPPATPALLRPESRVPAAISLLALVLLIEGLHDRFRLWPGWVGILAICVAWALMAGVAYGRDTRRWLERERGYLMWFAPVMLVSQAVSLSVLIGHILSGATDGNDGLRLLTSSAVIWGSNIIAFSVLYWQLDSGGPEERLAGAGRHADWLFPEAANPEKVRPGWLPGFADYLYLGFSTATAFSTTDVLPLTRRAKLLMMAESVISLATLAVVASRAINVLGS